MRKFRTMFNRLRILLLRLVPSPVLRLFEGFWATPLALSLSGIALAAFVHLLPPASAGIGWISYFNEIDVEGAKGALSVIAGGMVSLVTLVFSLTFVALSITAQQLSPRILDFVLRERSAQALLGLSMATFLFAAIVLTLGDAQGAWRLGLAMPVALALSGATLVMVVLFAHGMTRVMRAEEMVARLGRQFVANAHALLEPPLGCCAVKGDDDGFVREFDQAETIAAHSAGYVGTIDYTELLELAVSNGLKLALEVGEGDFLLPGVVIVRVLGLHQDEGDLAQRIEQTLNLTDRREVGSDAGYEAAALCEAALRALSPGINDPATAISCLNRLFEGLAVLVAAEAPPPRLLAPIDEADDGQADDDQQADAVARLLCLQRGAPELINAAVIPIIAAARGDARVLARIQTLTGQLDRLASHPRDRQALTDLREELAAGRTRHAASSGGP